MSILTSPDHAPPHWKDSHFLNVIMQLSVDLFPPVAILSSIPVFSIVIKYALSFHMLCPAVVSVLSETKDVPGVRYNVVENGFSNTFGFLWGVLFPWVAALPLLYQPDALNQFITFSSLVRSIY
jgi:hypothetical protein